MCVETETVANPNPCALQTSNGLETVGERELQGDAFQNSISLNRLHQQPVSTLEANAPGQIDTENIIQIEEETIQVCFKEQSTFASYDDWKMVSTNYV